MAHPLCGADPATLARVMRRAGLPEKPLAASAIALSVLARQPFSLAERLVMDRRLPATDALAPPVFILGHWRSGTTHLYNIMTKSGAWAYVPPIATGLPWDLFGLARAFRPLLERALPKHRYIDKIPVNPDSPQEDEIAIANMSDLSFYHGVYFPRAFGEFMSRGVFFDGCDAEEVARWEERFCYLMRKLSHLQGGKPLLIKNPVYTARMGLLAETFPLAKFIHIHRNPYDVFVSMRNFYKKLFAEFALQDCAHIDVDEVIVQVYARMMDAFEADAAAIDPARLVELRYDDLDEAPVAAVERVYDALRLSGFDAAKPLVESYVASVKSFEKNRFAIADDAAAKVEARLGAYVAKWGYRRPTGAARG